MTKYRGDFAPIGDGLVKDLLSNVHFSLFEKNHTKDDFCSDALNPPPPGQQPKKSERGGGSLERTQLYFREVLIFVTDCMAFFVPQLPEKSVSYCQKAKEVQKLKVWLKEKKPELLF